MRFSASTLIYLIRYFLGWQQIDGISFIRFYQDSVATLSLPKTAPSSAQPSLKSQIIPE